MADKTRTAGISIQHFKSVGRDGIASSVTWTPNASTATFTVDDAIEKIGFGFFQVFISFVVSMIWLAIATLFIILSILPFVIKCQWQLSDVEQALMTTALFLGCLIGSTSWGVFTDIFGRKKAMVSMVLIMLISGVLSAIKLTSDDRRMPGYPWILLWRFGIGFGSSCIPQVSTYYIEYIPKKMRAFCTVFVSGWWSVGSVLGVALALVTMGHYHMTWHWYLGLSTLPMAIAMVFVVFLPESARYYSTKGKHKKALDVLHVIARLNCASLPEGTLVLMENENSIDHPTKKEGVVTNGNSPVLSINSDNDDDDEYKPLITKSITKRHSIKQRLKERLSPFFEYGMWKVTAMLAIIWFATGSLYYGSILLTSTMVVYNPHCGIYDNSNSSNASSLCEDSVLGKDEYLQIMYTNFAEMFGLIVTLVVIEIIGRKFTLALILFLAMVGFSLLFLCTSKVVLILFLFISRAFTFSTIRVLYVYTSEVYPTTVRGMGIGVLNSVSRVGCALTPYIAQVLFRVSDYATIATYTGVSLTVVVLALLLPIETKQRSL